ncbi:MAG: ubiquinol oxidase subunit II [Gammaproteobacteria bacterium]
MKACINDKLPNVFYRIIVLVVLAITASGCNTSMPIDLEPSGPIMRTIDELFWTTVALMSLVLIPVFGMSAWFTWKYRASNSQASYAPDWDRSTLLEWLVWLIPGLIITILAGMTWIYSHRLDPFRPLESNIPPLEIQVVALDWKWLFIYPEQNIAAINELSFPVNRPINFKITSDTVMNSFFIPRLGGQIFAMAGMQTQLHLIADEPGRYFGENTQFSGRGFPYHNFVAIATSQRKFNDWIEKAKQSPQQLNLKCFNELAQASIGHPATYYASVTPDLFGQIMDKFKKGAEAPSIPVSPSNQSGDKRYVR